MFSLFPLSGAVQWGLFVLDSVGCVCSRSGDAWSSGLVHCCLGERRKT